MPKNLSQLKQYLIEGENEKIEFKEKIPHPDDFSAEIAALANTEGGMILIGVADDGQIKGLKKDYQKQEQTITNILRQNIYPALAAEIKFFVLNNKHILLLDIPKSPDRPHQTKLGRYYIRVGTSKRIATPSELARIFQDTGQMEYDSLALPKTSIKDINLDKVNNYFHQVYQRDLYSEDLPVERILLNLGILKNKEGQVKATIGGLLCFGHNPQSHQTLKSAVIKLAVHQGLNPTDKIIKREDIGGTLDEQIKKTEDLLRFYIKTETAVKDSFARQEKPQYPLPALREIVVNAVAHRNYSILGSAVRIFIFTDRLEIYSPGRLPNSMTLENLGYASKIRNQFIVTFLHQLKYVEDLGEGIIKARRFLRQNGNPDPKFELFDETFRVTIFGAF